MEADERPTHVLDAMKRHWVFYITSTVPRYSYREALSSSWTTEEVYWDDSGAGISGLPTANRIGSGRIGMFQPSTPPSPSFVSFHLRGDFHKDRAGEFTNLYSRSPEQQSPKTYWVNESQKGLTSRIEWVCENSSGGITYDFEQKSQGILG